MTSPYLNRRTRAKAEAARDFAERSKVLCLRCGKPMTDSDHWDCQHDDAKLRMYEEMIDG